MPRLLVLDDLGTESATAVGHERSSFNCSTIATLPCLPTVITRAPSPEEEEIEPWLRHPHEGYPAAVSGATSLLLATPVAAASRKHGKARPESGDKQPGTMPILKACASEIASVLI